MNSSGSFYCDACYPASHEHGGACEYWFCMALVRNVRDEPKSLSHKEIPYWKLSP